MQNGGLFAPQVKMAAWQRSGGQCTRCRVTLTPGVNVAYDHIHPWSLGGRNTVENCAVLCTTCNSRKGARA